MQIFQDLYFQIGVGLLITFVIGFACGREYERMDEDEYIQKKGGNDNG